MTEAVRFVEGEVRELIRRGGLDPSRHPGEVSQLIRDVISDYDERSLHGGLPQIVDHTENEIARITKTWQGLAKAAFTTADNYVLQIHRQLADPLLSMVVASALTVDTVISQFDT